MNTCIKCGCDNSYPSLPPSPTPAPCPDPQPCAEFFDAQCVVYTLPNITCDETTVVFQDDTVAAALQNIVDYFCEAIATLTDYVNAQLTIINNRLTVIEGDIVNIENDITSIQGDITTIEGDITTIEGDITNITTLVGQAMPVGSLLAWAGNQTTVAPPTGWLFCDGSTVSKTTYINLYNAIKDDFSNGAPIPTNQFYLPNLIEKIPYGSTAGNVGNLVGNNTMNGTVVGTATVNIDINNLPEHNHTLTEVSITGGTHGHLIKADPNGGGTGSNDGFTLTQNTTSEYNAGPTGTNWIYGGGHTHSFSAYVTQTGETGTTQASGTISGSFTEDNRQASVSIRYIIKY